MSQAAVFLDRDGTINREMSFLSDPARLILEERAVEGLAILQANGFALVVVSNQSGVARGYFDETAVRRVNSALAEMLFRAGIIIEGFFYCPHHPEGAVPEYARTCDCRKPKPGLLLRAAAAADIDFGKSYCIGDSARDLEAGRAVGVRTILVMTGFGENSLPEVERSGLADYVARDLADAAAWIVRDSRELGGSCVDG